MCLPRLLECGICRECAANGRSERSETSAASAAIGAGGGTGAAFDQMHPLKRNLEHFADGFGDLRRGYPTRRPSACHREASFPILSTPDFWPLLKFKGGREIWKSPVFAKKAKKARFVKSGIDPWEGLFNSKSGPKMFSLTRIRDFSFAYFLKSFS